MRTRTNHCLTDSGLQATRFRRNWLHGCRQREHPLPHRQLAKQGRAMIDNVWHAAPSFRLVALLDVGPPGAARGVEQRTRGASIVAIRRRPYPAGLAPGKGVVIDATDTGAACHTYNVLLSARGRGTDRGGLASV